MTPTRRVPEGPGAGRGIALALGLLAIAAGAGCPGDAPGGGLDAVAGPDGGPGSDGGAAGPDGGGAGDGGGGGADGAPAPVGPRLVGRMDLGDPVGPRFTWSGSAIVTRFSGTGIAARLRDDSSPGWSNHFTAIVDGAEERLAVNSSQERYVLATGLAAGEHELVLWRDTEGFFGVTQLLGLEPEGGELLPTPGRARRLEIVGDSITCGYGDLGDTQYCGFSPETESHWVTYGALAARALDADLVTVAYSGIGVYRDYGGDTSHTMPGGVYAQTLTDRADPAWDFARAVPDAVVINLGTNDFAQGLPPEAGFKDAYLGFVETIRTNYPQAWIVCAVGPMLSGDALTTGRAWIADVVAERQAAGDARVATVEFAVQDGSLGYGCDWHPSAATQVAMADVLEARLRELLGW